MGETTYYQKNMINAKINARDKYRNLSKDEKNKKREYGRRIRNMECRIICLKKRGKN